MHAIQASSMLQPVAGAHSDPPCTTEQSPSTELKVPKSQNKLDGGALVWRRLTVKDSLKEREWDLREWEAGWVPGAFPSTSPPPASSTSHNSSSTNADDAPATDAPDSQKQVDKADQRTRLRRSPLDAALAMQLRPGLGLGADGAWLIHTYNSLTTFAQYDFARPVHTCKGLEKRKYSPLSQVTAPIGENPKRVTISADNTSKIEFSWRSAFWAKKTVGKEEVEPI
ncbi:hypothetical protein C8R46DRAFT_1029170 [Mycena filopes]|nr:hypothetical protein C8R46DRAFT_1029170 [Mycena filopes]